MSGRRKKKQGGGGGGGGGHDGGGSLRWLLTYADMITLLMAFFIMMYSMSVLNLSKFNEVAFSIRSGFGGIMSGSGKHLFKKNAQPLSSQINRVMSEQQGMQDMERRMTEYARVQQLQNSVTVTRDARGLTISIAAEGLMFPAGSAELTTTATPLLDEVETILRAMRNNIVVEGHTCDMPIHTVIFPSNWELSTARACRVVRYFEDKGIPSKQLSAAGYGSTRPRFHNDTPDHRAQNRRVDIIVLSSSTENTAEPGTLTEEGASQDGNTPRSGIRPVIRKVWDSPADEGGERTGE